MTWTEIVSIFPATAALLTAVATSLITAGKIGKMAGTWEATIENQNAIIKELKTEVRQLVAITTVQAVQSSRLDAIDKRFDAMDEKIRELSHGEGFVLPLVGR